MLVAIFAAACAFALPAAEAPAKCEAPAECEKSCDAEAPWRGTLEKVKNLRADTGISGFISPIGTTIGPRLTWDKEGVLTATLELRSDKTIYVRYGDWIARIATYVAVLSLLYYVAYRTRKRNHLVD